MGHTTCLPTCNWINLALGKTLHEACKNCRKKQKSREKPKKKKFVLLPPRQQRHTNNHGLQQRYNPNSRLHARL